jgi:hypothetical protein
MNELIEAIRTAVAEGATTEQKAVGVQACRTIAAALDTEPGRPLVLPGVSPVQTTSRVSIDQVLDLMIARLSLVAKESEHEPKATQVQPGAVTAAPAVATQPRGFRVPVPPTSAIKAATRSVQSARPSQRVR